MSEQAYDVEQACPEWAGRRPSELDADEVFADVAARFPEVAR